MDEPVRSRLRPARTGGLTRPDPVTRTSTAAQATSPAHPPEITGQAAGQAAARRTRPGTLIKITFRPGRRGPITRIYTVDRGLEPI
jgi:hypothetical protein